MRRSSSRPSTPRRSPGLEAFTRQTGHIADSAAGRRRGRAWSPCACRARRRSRAAPGAGRVGRTLSFDPAGARALGPVARRRAAASAGLSWRAFFVLQHCLRTGTARPLTPCAGSAYGVGTYAPGAHRCRRQGSGGAAMLVLPRSAGRGLEPRQPHRNFNERAQLGPAAGGRVGSARWWRRMAFLRWRLRPATRPVTGGAGPGKRAAAPPTVTVAKPRWCASSPSGTSSPAGSSRCSRSRSRRGSPGYLQEIRFEDGQIVEAGQILFVIDPRPYEAAVDRAKAQIEHAAQAQLRLAELDQGRTSKLVTTSAAARATLDQRNAELAEASASLAGSPGPAAPGRARPRLHPRSPHRSPAGSPTAASTSAIWSTTQTLLTTIVQLDPIYLSFDMSESDFLAYQRAAAEGELPSTRDSRDDRPCPSRRRGRTGRTRAR